MSRRTLPALNAFKRPEGMETPAPLYCFDRWRAGVTYAGSTSGTVIDILDTIGIDPWTGTGIDTAFIIAKLRGAGDVTVNINSPGGDYFEGAAIYELLRGHAGAVTVNVLGLAASAASLIAMAGDDIRIGQTAFFMIHNCWGVCIGDRHDMTAAAATQGQIDVAMTTIYSGQSNQDEAAIAKMMDDESYIGAKLAVEQGFATSVLSADEIASSAQAASRAAPVHAQRYMDSVMAHQGVTRAERRRVFNEFKQGKPGAAPPDGMQDAASVSALAHELRVLHATF